MKTIFRITGYIFFSLALYCCNDFEDAEPSNNQMLWNDVFNDAQTARAAMIQVYADMRQNGFFTGNGNGIGCLSGCLTDELIGYSNIPDGFQAFYTLQLTDGSKTVKALWSSSYRQIYMCNAILQGVSQSTSLEKETIDKLRGEALFTRALLHFYLTNTFGDVPYITVTDYNENRKAHKNKTSVVYQKVVDDLEEAILLLPNQQDLLKTYPSKKTAYALLSRVLLYRQEYAKSYNVALSLLQDAEVSALQPLEKVFLKESSGTLWQFAPATMSANTLEGGFYVLNTAPSTRTSLALGLIEAFDVTDLRKTAWIGNVTGSSTFYFPLKYKEGKPSGASKEYSIVFRIEEQYLIVAEAAVALRQWEDANHWLSVFKASRGLVHEYSEISEVLLMDIQLQRRLEFFTEFGHRFYDLKRSEKLHEIMLETKPLWNKRFSLLPIPQTELHLNPNLHPQNAGY